ncbi:hypothetical protein [Spirillospora sp. CA-294931]|uniref:hypothetical protein n=1 Tax=Spirillospora sp. CA-294931 TaxID=3240042 RepID=UPI003D8B0186
MRPLRAAAAALALVLALSGCDLMQRISEGAYRNAVADGAQAELKERGIRLTGRPDCRTDGAGSVITVRCTATTDAGRHVAVTGVAAEAESANPRERYVITVDGRRVVDAACLGVACG